MKKILNFKIYGLLSLLIVISACSDLTDITQEGELTEEVAFSTLSDIQSGLNSVYGSYGPDSGGNGSGDVVHFNAIFTDNFKRGLGSTGQGNLDYSFILQPGSSFPATIWSSRYATINRVNRVLRAIDNIAFDEAELADVDHIKAQLYAFRALAHLDLFQYFTKDYTDANSLSVINIDFVPEVLSEFERNTVAETTTFIKNDLELALQLINDDLVPSNYYINSSAVKAIYARFALVTEDYNKALEMATDVVTDYQLADATEYPNVFAPNAAAPLAPNVEIVFQLRRTGGGAAGNFYFNSVDITGGAFYEMSNELYNAFDNDDIRKTAFVTADSEFNGVNDPTNILLIGKYPGSDAGLLTNDFKLLRVSEMVLVKAEAEARLNQLSTAATTLKTLADARLDSNTVVETFTNVNDALNTILEQRRLELCYEGHRYLDLKRIGGDINKGVDREDVDCVSFTATQCTLVPNDYRFTLPIPTSEIEGNSVITQNSDY
ncbi:MAG: RagB/SusD family nutrient uptake outer membrane protein [Flavobacteriaceae bacterium]